MNKLFKTIYDFFFAKQKKEGNENFAKQKTIIDPNNAIGTTNTRQTTQRRYFEGQTISSEFRGYLPELVSHSVFHHDFSYAVANLVNLGNTKLKIELDSSISKNIKKQVLETIDKANKRWDTTVLISDLLRQIAITGALSVEGYPDSRLNKVEKIVKVNPDSIYFDCKNGGFIPFQLVRQKVLLNTATYTYSALQTTDDSPYGIPPFLSVLTLLDIEKDMITNFANVAKRLGMFGFLEVLLTPDPNHFGLLPQDFESNQAFVNAVHQRSTDYLMGQSNEIGDMLKSGFVMGWQGQHEFKMTGSAPNAQGAKDMLEILDSLKMSGIKTNGGLQGRKIGTTETFGRVFLQILLSQVTTMQTVVSDTLTKYHRLNLILNGFNDVTANSLSITLKNPLLGDELKEMQTKQINQKLIFERLTMGIIDINQAANELGYSESYLKEMLSNKNPNQTKETKKPGDRTSPEGKLSKRE